jgi:type I restriction enzyme S subunit
VEVLLPPLPEQRRIAETLRTWDQAIILTEQLIAAKQHRKKALMQQLLTGQRRFREFVMSEDIKSTKFGDIPMEWDVKPLGSLVKPITRVEPVLSNRDYRLIGVRWYIEGAHIHSVLAGNQIMTASLSRIEEGDIVYNKMWASKAAFAIAKAQHQDAYGTMEYPQFRAKPDKLNINFLEYVYHLPRFLHDAKGLCRGTTGRARLNPGDFLKIEIPLPSLPEQRKIAAVLQACDEEIELLRQKLAALKRQKQGLMQQLLTGRVRVKPSP